MEELCTCASPGIKLTWASQRSVSPVAVQAKAVGVDVRIRDNTLKVCTCASDVWGLIVTVEAATAIVGGSTRTTVPVCPYCEFNGRVIIVASSTCIHRMQCKPALHTKPSHCSAAGRCTSRALWRICGITYCSSGRFGPPTTLSH